MTKRLEHVVKRTRKHQALTLCTLGLGFLLAVGCALTLTACTQSAEPPEPTHTEQVKLAAQALSSKAQTLKEESQAKANELTGSMGDKGRLYIPSVGVSVPLYNAPVESEEQTQDIVDEQNSAAAIGWEPKAIIADHNNQGFDAIKKCKAGTTAYVKTTNGLAITYTCVAVLDGTNYHNVWDENFLAIEKAGECDLILYTCNDNSNEVTIVTLKEQETLLTKRYLLS